LAEAVFARWFARDPVTTIPIVQLDHDEDFARGAKLYAIGRYWDAHEAWESLWRSTQDDEVRLLVQGLIQVTAALYKLYEKQDRDAAERLFRRAIEKLESVPSVVHGVQVAPFLEAAIVCRDVLEHDQDKNQGGLRTCRIPALSFVNKKLEP